MVTIDFKLRGTQTTQRYIAEISDRAADAEPALAAVGERMVDLVKRNFASEGQATGGWAPLSQAYLKEKARRGLDLRILRATDTLYDSLTRMGNSRMIFTVTPTKIEYGSRVRTITYHQEGTEKMPARPILVFSNTFRTEASRVVKTYIAEGKILEFGRAARRA